MKQVIHFIWGLPQNLVGLFMMLFLMCKGRKVEKYRGRLRIYWEMNYGLSMGNFIFAPRWSSESLLRHEWGHTFQSWMLGPLYLLIIGIPSGIWCGCFEGYRKKNGVSYYAFWPEKWANHLGGLDDKGRIIKD